MNDLGNKSREVKLHYIHIDYFTTPVGELILGEYDRKLVLCDWRYRKMRPAIDERIKKFTGADFRAATGGSEIIASAIQQLKEYFDQKRKQFELPILFAGSAFQQLVWEELMQIPYGKTETYLSLSQKLGDTKAIRAVAAANGANAISIIIPCHRIIGSDGSLVGYAGGLPAKKKLLQLERALPVQQLELYQDGEKS